MKKEEGAGFTEGLKGTKEPVEAQMVTAEAIASDAGADMAAGGAAARGAAVGVADARGEKEDGRGNDNKNNYQDCVSVVSRRSTMLEDQIISAIQQQPLLK